MAQAAGVSSALAGNIQRGTVIHRSANKGQAQSDIYRTAKAEMLEYRQALVMVHGDHRIALLQSRRIEGSVCGNWPVSQDAIGTATFDSRQDDGIIFRSKVSAFSSVRVEAEHLQAGFIPARKPGKLPWRTSRMEYDLEYGTDTLEIHAESISAGDRVLIHDDVLATGGTARAMCDLVESLGGEVVQCNFLIELSFLNGRQKLNGFALKSLITY